MTTAHIPQSHANRLFHETSPYLRQHAYNPVDWYPWGAEALSRARAEDKPIFLSIGYSACHWCHVMAHESFEDPQTAKIMNELFINIKVDREERPDLDGIYMAAVQAMTGHGGWPMSVWLLPDGAPFYGGTYFPPHDRYGMPGFRRVLVATADAYRTRRSQVEESAARMKAALQSADLQGWLGSGEGALDAVIAEQAVQGLTRAYDSFYGGFGHAPKFPQPMNLSFLLRYHQRTEAPDTVAAAYPTGGGQVLEMITHTLHQMARGGMYDQLGGGFHRYSVDERWLVPHFEKMLYDNAQLARVYTEAWLAGGDPFFRAVAEETLDYLAREMRDPAGAFYSSQDADSEGEEGKFFLWTPQELTELLGAADARLAGGYYGVTPSGNFEGQTILHIPREAAVAAQQLGVDEAALRAALARSRPVLLAARQQRIKPGRDDKALAEWNGMTLRAFAYAAGAFGRADYRRIAEANAAFLLDHMSFSSPSTPLTSEGLSFIGLHRTWAPATLTGDAAEARLNGYLEDYANVADGLIELYQLTFAPRWLHAARALADAMLARFWDNEQGGFFQTSHDHETLLTRPREFVDNAVPSGNSVAADVLLRLYALTGEERYHSHGEAILLLLREAMARQPLAFGHLLGVLERALSRPQEIVVIGDPADPATLALLTEVRSRFLPHAVLAGAASEAAAQAAAVEIPLLADRTQFNGAPTAYVCENFTCHLPVSDPDALARELSRS